jgi:hypothetical protein
MQRDFHYNAVKTLAQKAGFEPEEAQIIAYASEYVDDAIDYNEIELDFEPKIKFGKISGKTFNPICTAHRGLQIIKALNQDIQEKVYISFHFIPEIRNNQICYLTQPNNNISNELVDIALDELSGKMGEERIQKLIKLGIAIHSYADTWSHQNFSGRHNSAENDIVDIEILQGSTWVPVSNIKNIQYSAMPDIGHAEANNFPDLSHLKWRYTKAFNKNLIIRDNTLICMQAANQIFNKFVIATNSNNDWNNFDFMFLQCFNKKTENLEDKYQNYKLKFPDLEYNYDEYQWKKDALAGKDNKWFYFHIEALNQRNFILNKIKEKEDCEN